MRACIPRRQRWGNAGRFPRVLTFPSSRSRFSLGDSEDIPVGVYVGMCTIECVRACLCVCACMCAELSTSGESPQPFLRACVCVCVCKQVAILSSRGVDCFLFFIPICKKPFLPSQSSGGVRVRLHCRRGCEDIQEVRRVEGTEASPGNSLPPPGPGLL